jgi:hypothetical protein
MTPYSSSGANNGSRGFATSIVSAFTRFRRPTIWRAMASAW